MINMLNLYLEPEREADLKAIQDLIKRGGVEGEKGLEAYAREAIRIDPPFAGVYRTCILPFQSSSIFFNLGIFIGRATTDTQAGDLAVKNNDTLFLSIYLANRDVRLQRCVEGTKYLLFRRRASSPSRHQLTLTALWRTIS